VDGDGDEEGGGGEEGGDREPFFFLTFGVGGRSGARVSDGGCGGRRHEEKNLYYYLAGRASEIEGMEYFIARKEKSDIMNSWEEFLEKMEYGRANRVLR
jgi:hypothetical protein